MDYVRLGSTGLGVSRLCLSGMSYGTSGGPTHPCQLDEAITALDVRLDARTAASLEALYKTRAPMGHNQPTGHN